MKKICFAFNHLQFSDGVARSAIGIANALAQRDDVQVTLRPIFKYDPAVLSLLSDKVVVKPLFRTYFRGLSQLIYRLPGQLLHDLIFRGEYDIHVGFQYLISTKAVASGKKSRAKRYIWMHGYDEGLTMRESYLKADKVMCVSRHNAGRLSAELDGKVPVYPCYNLIDDGAIYKQAEQKNDLVRPNTPLFATVGRLSPEKGFERLIQVFGRLRDDGLAFHFWLIGDGPEREKLSSLVVDLELTNHITLLGEQTNPHQYTNQADVFVCSSFAEGYSTACCEASILGIPVISTDVSGAREIIQDAEAGLVVGLDDESLYRGMKQVLEQPELLTRWRTTLVETRSHFHASHRIDHLFNVLELEN